MSTLTQSSPLAVLKLMLSRLDGILNAGHSARYADDTSGPMGQLISDREALMDAIEQAETHETERTELLDMIAELMAAHGEPSHEPRPGTPAAAHQAARALLFKYQA